MTQQPAESGFGIPAGIPAEAVWNSLVSEPSTGVSIMSRDGFVLYLNEQAAKILVGVSAKAEDLIGRRMDEVLPKELVAHRLSVFERVIQTGKPVLSRSVWGGRQVHSWINHIDADGVDESDSADLPGRETPERFLTIIKYVEGTDVPAEVAGTEYEYVESDVVDLGPLDILSPRELEVLALIGQGMSSKQVASTLFRSVKTIENHRASIGAKLQVDDRIKLSAIAHRAGLTLKDAGRDRTESVN